MNQFTLPLLCLTLFAAWGIAAAEAGATREAEHPSKLHRYLHCDGFAEGVRGVTLDRRPADAPLWREVVLDGKSERVSVVDGYRVMYSYPRTYPFANLKVERSDPAHYDADKRIVTGNFAAIAAADADVTLAGISNRGFSGQTLTKRHIGGTTLGITQILSDEDSVIVTIYFLNQAPENRRFQTYEEFISLRDSFVHGYLECLAAAAFALGPTEEREPLATRESAP